MYCSQKSTVAVKSEPVRKINLHFLAQLRHYVGTIFTRYVSLLIIHPLCCLISSKIIFALCYRYLMQIGHAIPIGIRGFKTYLIQKTKELEDYFAQYVI